jgi:bifunctional non-homologous end joining protein LigD
VPKGPSLDPADKRLAMQVEDHPVSYFDFEGNIPENNYGAGSVMVWDVGQWQPLSPVQVDGKYVPASDQEARAMIKKGDLKFRLDGQRLKGDFALIKMHGRRAGSKGNEWLLIKKHDQNEVEDFDIDQYDSSVLTQRSMDEIAGDNASAEWRSRPAGRGKLKAPWLADAIAKLDQKKAAERKSVSSTVSSTKAKTRSKKSPSSDGKQSVKAEPVDIRASAPTEKKTKKTRLKSA